MRQFLHLFRHSLRLRLVLATEIVLLATLALVSVSGSHILDDSLLAQLRMRVGQLEPLLANTVTHTADAGGKALDDALSDLTRHGGFDYVVVFDKDGAVRAHSGWDRQQPLPAEDSLDALPPDRTLDRRMTLTRNGEVLGSIRFGLALDDIRAARAQATQRGMLIIGAGLVASLALLAYLGRVITRELDRINAGARQIAEGNLSLRVTASKGGELADIAESLNTLAAHLETRVSELRANEERLGLVIQGTADGVWDWDLVSDQHYYSPRYRELLGYADEREFRQQFSEEMALHPAERDRVLLARKRHLEERQAFDQEFRLRTRSGDYRWFHGRAQAVWNAAGQPVRFAGTISDIDDRRGAEQALRDSEDRFDHVVRAAADGIWDWDMKRSQFHLSNRMKSALGYADAELPDERASFFRVIHPADLERVRREIASHFAQRVPFDTELRLCHKDGTAAWFRARGHAVWGEDGRVARFSGACFAIAAQKEAEERVVELLAEKQVLIDNVQVGIAYIHNGVIASINRRMTELFASPAADLVGTSPINLCRNSKECDDMLNACLAANGSSEVMTREVELERRNGETFWGIVTGRPLDPARPEEGAIWIFLDNSDRRKAIVALQNERDFSDALINGMPGVFYLVDRDGRFLRWNHNLETVTGRSPEEISNLNAIDLFAEDDHAEVREATYRVFKQGEYQRELPIRTRDGQRIPFLLTGVRIEIDGMTHVMGIGFDITRRLGAEEQVRRLNDELELRVRERTAELAAANKELESFAYSVSHDLSAPLRGIDGFSRMLTEDFGALLPEVGRSYVGRIRAASQRMQQLIDDLLRLSRVTREEIHREWLDMSAMATEILDELRAAQPERAVYAQIEPGLSVFADANLLRIALSNLLRNAWKFTSRHTAARIELGVLRDGNHTVYFVKDDGAGFDMRYAGRLFGAFHRLHRASEFEGTGIGLAIVSRVLLRHGGRIWAEAEIDKGATFFFTLDLGAANGHGPADPAG